MTSEVEIEQLEKRILEIESERRALKDLIEVAKAQIENLESEDDVLHSEYLRLWDRKFEINDQQDCLQAQCGIMVDSALSNDRRCQCGHHELNHVHLPSDITGSSSTHCGMTNCDCDKFVPVERIR